MSLVRYRTSRGDAQRERGLTPGPEGDAGALLRPVLEVAWAVARLGEEMSPPVPAPKALRPFLRFSRLPASALGPVRRALDEDEDFRGRVAPAATEEHVGRAGYLLVARPEGWQDELATLQAAAEEQESAARDEGEERSARRRVRGAEDAARRAEDALKLARADLARVGDELSAERKARRAVEEELAASVAAEAKLRAEAGSSRATAQRARAEWQQMAAEVERLEEERARLDTEVAELRATITSFAELPPPFAPAESTEPTASGSAAPVASGVAVFEAVGRAVADAADAAGALGRALAEAAAALGPLREPVDAEVLAGSSRPPSAPEGEVGVPPEEGAPVRATPRPAGPKRSAAALPPAIFDDSVEAADHLVRLNGVVLLVDGYNVSKLRWPELSIAEQRERLVSALGRVAARTGADIHAVFDGAEQVEATLPPGPRRLVRVSFSPPGIEADDVLLEMIDTIPAHRPVVVASSDRRVRDGAVLRGANAISSPQLVAVLAQ